MITNNMKILIAPLHYVANSTDGSEYSRAYDYLFHLSKQNDISGDVLVGYMKEKRVGNFRIHSLFKSKPSYISIYHRLKFILFVFVVGVKLSRHNNYDLIWHNGPFAIGETFSLLSIWNRGKLPFIVGPIVTPHTYHSSDEAHSMGSKLKLNSILINIHQWIDNAIYDIARVLGGISKITLDHAIRVVAKDSAGAKLLSKSNIKNVVKLTIPTDITKFFYKRKFKQSSSIVNLISVSYLVERKRTQDIIMAIKLLIDKYKIRNFHLKIVGNGPQFGELRELVYELGVHKHISLIGYIPKANIPAYYQQADIFVSASVSESMPAMYFEAMASSLPLVIVKNSSVKDLRNLKFGGFVCKPSNPDSIAKELSRLLRDKSLIHKYGSTNYLLAQHKFDIRKEITKLVSLFESVVGKRK